jgi:4-amino-4-deoxy-L-arabinose transferase-like glycosyltransferase
VALKVTGWKRRALLAGALLAGSLSLFLLGAAAVDRPLGRLARSLDDTESTGSWWFPRGGPYVLGFESASHTQLWIDGALVAEGKGRVVEPTRGRRLVYEPGAHAVRVVGPADTQLLWHPPGRRGAPEYVAGSSTSPDPPEKASFSSPGAAIFSGGAAIGSIVALLGAIVVLLRPRFDRRTLALGLAVFAIAALARVIDLDGVPQTWDEDEYWSSGRNYVVNVLRLDFRPSAWTWNYQHPPVTKYIAGLGALLADGLGPARVLFALLGAGTAALAFAIGRRLFGEAAGVISGIAAALAPHLLAHGRIVGHETPSLFFWALAAWLALRVSDDPDDRVRVIRRLVWVGAALGLAVGTRFTNLLAAPIAAAAILVSFPRDRWFAPALKTSAIALAVVPIAAAIVFFATWPRMWDAPLAHLDQAYDKLKLPHTGEPYLGVVTRAPPWHYFAVALVATTPILILAASLLAGPARAFVRREKGWIVVGVFLLAAFGIVRSPIRQDGVRYVLPALFALCLAAGAGLAWLGDWLGRRKAILAHAPLAVLSIYLVVSDALIHPYYLDYFGEHMGGAGGVQRRRTFEVGWWGEGIDRAVDHINRHAAKDAVVSRLVDPTHLTWFRVDLWKNVIDQPVPNADWLIVDDTYPVVRCPAWRPGPADRLDFEVRAQGASLVRVYRREGPQRVHSDRCR